MRALLIAVCSLAAALPVVQAQSPQQPTFRSGVDVVAVDVHVVDESGRPLTGLRPDEFTVTVGGKRRTIVAADYVSHGVATSTTPASRPTAPVPLFTSNRMLQPSTPGRTILIVVDDENIASGYGRAAAQAVGRFLDLMQPNDRVGLVVIPRSGVAIDPTTDRAVVRRTLTSVVGHQVSADAGSMHSLGQAEAFALLHNQKQWGEVVGRECGMFQEDPGRFKACISELTMYARAIITDSRRRQVDSIRSLAALFDSLAQLPGPKTVVLISQQLPVAPYLPERSDFDAEARALAQAAARARVSVYVLHLDLPPADIEQRMMPLSESEDRYMASFGLETITSVTGGNRMMVSGRPEGAFDRLALEISGYYLLGFRSEPADRDGRLHEIKVAVKRKGIEVRARQMFTYAPETAPAEDGALTVGYSITDAAGKRAGASVEPITLKPAQGFPAASLCYLGAAVVPPGSYTLRVAAAASALRGGSVVHRFDARPTEVGPLTLSDLIVFDRYPSETGKPRPSVSAMVAEALSGYPVQGPDSRGRLQVSGTVDARALPAGTYVARAVLESAGKTLGRVTRPIRVLGEPANTPPVPSAAAAPSAPSAAAPPSPPPDSTKASLAQDARRATVQSTDRRDASSLNDVLHRMSQYVMAYGAQASMFVGTENYTQRVEAESGGVYTPRHLVSEFAIVKAGTGEDWVGYRDVVEVNDKAVVDQRDRLLGLLTSASVEASQLKQIADESARYNIGPISRNFNVPTTMLFFFHPATIGRFSFERKGTKEIEGAVTWELEFTETVRPALIRTREGRDVPCNGRVWVVPGDGTVVRTRLELRNFANEQQAPPPLAARSDSTTPPTATRSAVGGAQTTSATPPASAPRTTNARIESLALIEVTYRLDQRLGAWLPLKMSETYEGAMPTSGGREPFLGRATGVAEYSGFKRFETSAKIVVPK